jgi:phospholipid/cholesterol/gamma-HCH transport system permease protein
MIDDTGFHIAKDTESGHLLLQGTLDLYHSQKATQALEKELSQGFGQTVIDVSGLTKLDTVGALLLRQLQEEHKTKIQHLKPEHARIFRLVAKAEIAPPATVRPEAVWRRLLGHVGEKTVFGGKWTIEIIAFLGQACVTFFRAVVSPKHLRFADIMHQIEETGIHAVPIISAMAFMIAVVLAYQGIAQLRPLGVENLTVNLVAISVLREMGVLLTAIMVAGRSGSAFAAEIGVMKVREEVDALQVIGINPFEMLVMPRLIALIITLPLLTFLADIMGLFGGGIMSKLLIDIPLGSYMERVRTVAHGDDFLVGMIKAPVFAFLIAMIGCMHGMKVSGSAEGVGHETTAAVVKGIFLVLVVDALFSVLFEKMGI